MYRVKNQVAVINGKPIGAINLFQKVFYDYKAMSKKSKN